MCVAVLYCCDVQISLVPFGLHNVHLPSAESQQEAYKMARQLPAGVVSVRQWCYGELEFDALMRQLDNAVSSVSDRCCMCFHCCTLFVIIIVIVWLAPFQCVAPLLSITSKVVCPVRAWWHLPH